VFVFRFAHNACDAVTKTHVGAHQS
jgi:hypothetical protein